MKIHILFDIRTGPCGGGNQFLKGLKEWLVSQRYYAETHEEADAFIFNSHQHIEDVVRVKRKYPEKPFIHRIDGPMRLYNQMNDRRDLIVNRGNRLIADGTVFQSAWSRDENFSLGLEPTLFHNVIHNAPDPVFFNERDRVPPFSRDKIRLIAVSWSVHENKGFDVYQWLDENLDFARYEMVFLGNSPVNFKNIHEIPPVGPEEVAKELKKSDIYVIASRVEACSNTLMESLHCGLAVAAIDKTSHKECIRGRGEIFSHPEEIPELLVKISTNPKKYLNNQVPPSMSKVGENYYHFIHQILGEIKRGNYRAKCLGFSDSVKLHGTLLACKCHALARMWLNRFWPKGHH